MCGSIPGSKQCKAEKLLPLGPFGLVHLQLHESGQGQQGHLVKLEAALTSSYG